MTLDLDFYLSVPWTVRREEHHDDGDYLALTVDELPGFIVASRSEEELAEEYWDALEAYLASYLRDQEQPPLPAGLAEALKQVDAKLAELLAPSAPSAGRPEGDATSVGRTLPGILSPARRAGRAPVAA